MALSPGLTQLQVQGSGQQEPRELPHVLLGRGLAPRAPGLLSYTSCCSAPPLRPAQPRNWTGAWAARGSSLAPRLDGCVASGEPHLIP